MSRISANRHARRPLEELASALGLSAASRAMAMVATLAINALLARQLPLADYAYLGVQISISTFLTIFLQLGFQTSIVRIAGQAVHSGETDDLSASLVAGFITTIVMALLVLPLFLFAPRAILPPTADGGPLALTAALSLIVILTMSLNTFIGEALRGLGRVGTAATLTGMGQQGGIARSALLLAVLAAMATMWRVDLDGSLAAGIGASLVVCLIGIRELSKHNLHFAAISAALSSFRARLAHNLMVLSGQMLQLLASMNLAVFIAGMLFASGPLALYIAAYQTVFLINAPLALFNGASPKLLIVAHSQGDKETLEKVMRVGSTLAFLVALSASLVLVLFGSWLFQQLYGPKFGGAALFFALMVPGTIFNAFGGTAARALLLLGFEKDYLRYSIVAAISAVPLFCFAALKTGPEGLALATSIMLVLQNIALVAIVRRRLDVWTVAYLRPSEYVDIARKLFNRIRPALRETSQ